MESERQTGDSGAEADRIERYLQTPEGWARLREAVRSNFESFALNSQAFEYHVKGIATTVVDEKLKELQTPFWKKGIWTYIVAMFVVASGFLGAEFWLDNIVSRSVVKALKIEDSIRTIATKVQTAQFFEKVALGENIVFQPNQATGECQDIIKRFGDDRTLIDETSGELFFKNCFISEATVAQGEGSLSDRTVMLVPAEPGDVLAVSFLLYGDELDQKFDSRRKYLFSEILLAKNNHRLLGVTDMGNAKDLKLLVDGKPATIKQDGQKGFPIGDQVSRTIYFFEADETKIERGTKWRQVELTLIPTKNSAGDRTYRRYFGYMFVERQRK